MSAGDIHGDLPKVEKYLADCDKEGDTDFATAAGDYLFQPDPNVEEAKQNLRPLFRLLSKSSFPIMVLGGNYEAPGITYDISEEFGRSPFSLGARSSGQARAPFPGNSMKRKDFLLVGVEGSNPINGQFPGERSEDELAWAVPEAIQPHNEADGTHMLLVTHAPPFQSGTRDQLGSFGLPPNYWGKHVGSTAFRSFIFDKKPLLHICGHVHEGVGVTVSTITMEENKRISLCKTSQRY